MHVSVVRQPHFATLSPSPAGQGKRTFTEVEQEMALEELRHMRKLAVAVRELKLKDPAKWATPAESHIPC
jgi:hypothetical protein